MRGGSGFRIADLDRLAARLADVELASDDRLVLDELLAFGRESAASREAAHAAGLLIGSTPLGGGLSSIPEAFGRAFAPGTRASIGTLPPHT